MIAVAANGAWTVSKAQSLFTQQEDNIDMTIVDGENRAAAHWYTRWRHLVSAGCPKVVAYDTIAARARKSRRTIQNIVKVCEYFDASQVEEYSPAGITFLMEAVRREEPERFMNEAMRHPNTNLETLCMEFPLSDMEDELPRPRPPYISALWGAARRCATLPKSEAARAVRHIQALNAIFERNGIE